MISDRLALEFRQRYTETQDLYHFLNNLRNWFNAEVVNYEIYLEDNWFEGKTTIEYIVRCLDTFNIVVLAEDEYENNQQNGVWNLGNYVKTYWVVEDPLNVIQTFILANTPLQYSTLVFAPPTPND